MDRQEYLKQWRAVHSMDYYNKNKKEILKKQREKREKKKGTPLNSHNTINLKKYDKRRKKRIF